MPGHIYQLRRIRGKIYLNLRNSIDIQYRHTIINEFSKTLGWI